MRRSYYAKLDRYWEMIDSMRTEGQRTEGLIPEWAHDFVSIHERRGEYSLLGPMCAVKHDRRPRFEKHEFKTFKEAKAAAVRIAARRSSIGTKIHVVNCVP